MESVLLDTHTLIWMVSDEEKLGNRARDVLFESNARKYISPATYWEMAIKIKTGKLELNSSYDEFLAEAIQEYDLRILHIQPDHTSLLTTLDLFHKDPFDRLLVAQASVEGIPLISIDSNLDPYPVERWWEYDLETDAETLDGEEVGEDTDNLQREDD